MATKVLKIVATARGEDSYSLRVADAFVDEFEKAHPDAQVVTLDLHRTELPAFNAEASQGKYAVMYGKPAPDSAKSAWKKVEAVIQEFKSADVYAFAVPMWNFGIPYVLKHYVDVIVQPTYTFKVGPKGYEGLVLGKKAFAAYARGGAYAEGSGMEKLDHQKPYLELVLGMMGITDVKSAVVEPTLAGGKDQSKAALDAALQRARAVAREL